MFTDSNLRELVEFKAPEPVLSVYLNTEPSKGNADAYKLRLRNLLKEVALPQDTSIVETYFNQGFDWSGRSVAVFSCAPRGFFRVYSLALPLEDRVTVGDRPSVKPLADLWDNFGGYGVIVVDKQGARLFSFHLGELIEQEGLLGEIVKHTKRGGASSFPGRRGGVAGRTNYEDEVVDRNMKDVVDFAVRFFEEKHIRRILIGGTDDNIAQLRSLMPKAWQSLIVGTFHMSMTASHSEVLVRALEMGNLAERQREAHMIENLVNTAAKGGTAQVGIDKALSAVVQGRALTLVINEGFRLSGFHCPSCGNLFTEERQTCPNCGKPVEAIPDLIEAAVSSMLRQKGNVEVVHKNLQLEKAGNIGVILRY
jgi:peptide chain release factor subunit 1